MLHMNREQSGCPKGISRKILSSLAAILIALVGILALTAIHRPERMDYIEYWSSGKLIVQHANPYSPAGIFNLEKSAGSSFARPLIMLNPPWTLFLVAPLGLLTLHSGLFLWLLAGIACVLASILLLDKHAKNRPLALAFAPVFACICSGQSSPLLLLGFTLFLTFHRRHPFTAGASLLLMAIKPHLFLVFWGVLLVDCIYQRRFRLLAGGVSALVASTALALCFDFHVLQHYLTTVRWYHVQQSFLPTTSMLLRMLIDTRAFWLLFVPSILATAWGLWYYSRWKHAWDWKFHGMLLMLVTILASPYGFFSDEIVLLPSIAFALSLTEKRRYSGWILLAINTAALAVLATGAQLSSPYYLWTPAAWFAWFLYATNGFRIHRQQEDSLAASSGIRRFESV